MTTQPTNSQFLFLFRHPVDMPEPSPDEMQKSFEKWMVWITDLKTKNIYHGGERLEDEGSVLRSARTGKNTDGPFVEGKEVVGGFVLVSAADMNAALEIAKGCPGLAGVHTVEVRAIAPL